jgi:PAS domain S-box-containing protein
MQDGGHTLAELIDLPRLQRVCNGLSAASGITLAVLDTDGSVLVDSGWQDICTRFHRRDPTSARACRESDRRINERVARETDAPTHFAYRCANGLWDVAFPLVLEDDHVATVFTGQFFYDDDAVDREEFRARARSYGFDEDAYLEALARVPVLTHAQVEQTIAFLADLVGMLSELGLNAVRHERDHAALVASERQYRSLAEDMPVLVCATDAGGTITYINEAAAAAAGSTADDLVGTSVEPLLDADARKTVVTARRGLTPEQPVESHEERRRDTDGDWRWYQWTNRGFFDEEGDLLRVQAVGLDVTESRRAQEQAQQGHARLMAIFDGIEEPIYVSDPETYELLYVNEALVSGFGTPDGRTCYDFLQGRDAPCPFCTNELLFGENAAGAHVWEFRNERNGRWYRCIDKPIAWPDGRTVRYEMAIDVTEQREAEEELRRSRQQYETFINATTDMAFLKDAAGRYLIVNQGNADFFGLSPAAVIGMTDDELMEPAHADACRASDAQALEQGGLVVTTESQGDRLFETRKFPVTLADGTVGIGGYARDVTEQRRAEAEILRLAGDLERRVDQRTAQLAATNRELESFAYSISHDLRAPLRALDGFSEILLQDYGNALDETGRGHLGRIKGAANHMAGLMDGLLQLSRLNRDELDLQQVDLSALATAITAELRESEPERDVDVRIEPGVAATADPKLARAVIANLIGNAWKFTSGHEHALIEFGEEPAPRGRAGAVFFVRDDGAGFDMRYAENLFGAFQRLHTPDQFEGTGIGLATVQRIVHRHGGSVWGEGEVEKGATFRFTFAPAMGS